MTEKNISLEQLRDRLRREEASAKASQPTGPESGASSRPSAASSAAPVESSVVTRPPMPRDQKGRVYATGRRKTSVARVFLKAGKGDLIINNKACSEYFRNENHRILLMSPLRHANPGETYDVWCTVRGGGLSGQAGAIRHGISVALQGYDVETRKALKSAGFLTVDSRQVERKKPGRKKARKSFQFSKR